MREPDLSTVVQNLERAHKTLQTSAITLYRYEADSEQLNFIWQVGVARPGFMTGAAWEPIFKWERPVGGDLIHIKCFDGEHLKPKEQIPEEALMFRKKASLSFQDRQRSKHTKHGSFKFVKVCFWTKRNGKIGPLAQLFFTFFDENNSPFFLNRIRKSRIHSICESLIPVLRQLKFDAPENRYLTLVTKIQRRFEEFAVRDLRNKSVLRRSDANDPAPILRRASRRRFGHYNWRFLSSLSKQLLRFAEQEGGSFNATADVFLLHAEKIGWRYSGTRKHKLLINKHSLLGECIQNGKEFCYSEIKDLADPITKQRFQFDPFVKDCDSTKIIPITIDNEIRMVIRFLWRGQRSFTPELVHRIQQIRSAATYGVLCYDDWMQRNGIQTGLDLFATYPTKHGLAAAYELLAGTLHVLEATRIVYHHVSRDRDGNEIIGGTAKISTTVVPENRSFTQDRVDLISRHNSRHGAREGGATATIHRIARERADDLLFCYDVLDPELRSENLNYLLAIYSEDPFPGFESQRVIGGWRVDLDSSNDYPVVARSVPLKDSNLEKEHSEWVIPLRSHDREGVAGIVWIVFKRLRQLAWWERYFIRDLMRYVGFVLRGSLIQLGADNFGHMIRSLTKKTLGNIDNALHQIKPSPRDGRAVRQNTTERTLRMAADLIEYIHHKCLEMGELLRSGRDRRGVLLPICMKQAWSIADSLRTLSSDFGDTNRRGRIISQAKGFKIVYESIDLLERLVPPYVFSLVVNALSNAVIHGRGPYAVWVSLSGRRLRLVCANGASCPPFEDFLKPLIIGQPDGKQRVGITLIHHLTHVNGGSWQVYDRRTAREKLGNLPSELLKCSTFFVIQVIAA